MARIKKFLAAISAVVTLCIMSICSINVSAVYFYGFIGTDGKYHTGDEIKKCIAYHCLYLELDESIATKKVSEENVTTYVLDADSELYKYMRDNFGLTSNELFSSYIKAKYDSQREVYFYDGSCEIIDEIDRDSFSKEKKEEVELYRTLSDKDLEAIHVKRVAGVIEQLGRYHKTLNIGGSTPEHPEYKNIIDIMNNEVEPLGANYVYWHAVLPASTLLDEPVDVEVLSGDLSMDGKVNIVDAVKLAKYNADPTAYPLLTYSQLAADVNGDGELTNSDLIALVKMI